MKKTIAILLVLVIGMVGVWAAPTTVSDPFDVTIGVTTKINPVNQLAALSAPTIDWSNYDATDINGTDVSVTSASETSIGYIHSRSNNRAGYKVEMTAGVLSSANSGVTGASNSLVNLGYTVKAYDTTGTFVTGAESSTISAPGSAGSKVEITTVSSMTGLEETYRQIKATIPTFATALAGEYFADITFEFSAQ